MDWAGIEELVYSEASDPGRLLGEHVIKEGLLIQAFLPNAEKVSVKSAGNCSQWKNGDEERLFAVLFRDRKELVPYHFCITSQTGTAEIVDPTAISSTPRLQRKKCGSSVRGSIMIPMGNSGSIRRWKPGSRAFILRCRRRMRCASALA